MWFFEAITGFFLVFQHKITYPQNYFADIVENTPRNLSGGPLLPKIASVTSFQNIYDFKIIKGFGQTTINKEKHILVDILQIIKIYSSIDD